MTTEERFTLWLDNEQGLYHAVNENRDLVIDEGHRIEGFETFLEELFYSLCGIDGPVPSFLGDFLDIPDFEELAAELVHREREERRVA